MIGESGSSSWFRESCDGLIESIKDAIVEIGSQAMGENEWFAREDHDFMDIQTDRRPEEFFMNSFVIDSQGRFGQAWASFNPAITQAQIEAGRASLPGY